MWPFIKQLLVYFVAFVLSLYALSGVDFEKIMKSKRTQQIQTLYIILSMVLAYLLGEFLLAIMCHYI